MNLNTENIETKLKKPIVLIGMMGTGKTHIGKMLAESLSFDFYDSDQIIEERGGLSINEIFELYGEERFRQSEEKTILELLQRGACVIATGGGAPMNPNVLNAIKKHSISVWLKGDVESIYNRVKQSKTRPLLNNEDPKAVLKGLLAEREHIYKQANITLKTDGNNANETLNVILSEVNRRV